MDLKLHKIEQGVMDGLVLYNNLVEKSMEEIAETGRRRERNAQLKAMRRKEQARILFCQLSNLQFEYRRCGWRRSGRREKKRN